MIVSPLSTIDATFPLFAPAAGKLYVIDRPGRFSVVIWPFTLYPRVSVPPPVANVVISPATPYVTLDTSVTVSVVFVNIEGSPRESNPYAYRLPVTG